MRLARFQISLARSRGIHQDVRVGGVRVVDLVGAGGRAAPDGLGAAAAAELRARPEPP